MLKKAIKYTDLDGVERTEEFYFNLTQSEIAEMELSTSGGLTRKIERIVAAQDGGEMIRFFKQIILKSFGVKSEDGRRFVKNLELTQSFEQSMAYDALFMELVTNPDQFAAFVAGIVPQINNTPQS